MTDPELADRTYIEPLTAEFVEAIIKKERPDALLPTVGGQTALNIAIELDEAAFSKNTSVEMIGAKPPAVKMAEDRLLFKQAMAEDWPRYAAQRSGQRHARSAADGSKVIGFPIVIRPSFTLGGTGGGIAFNAKNSRYRSARSDLSPVHDSPDRRIRYRMERIRARSDARPERQRRHHLLHRKLRSDGRAHRRFDHRRAGADVDRSRISALRDAAIKVIRANRRRNRRLEHSIRDQPRERRWSSSK